MKDEFTLRHAIILLAEILLLVATAFLTFVTTIMADMYIGLQAVPTVRYFVLLIVSIMLIIASIYVIYKEHDSYVY